MEEFNEEELLQADRDKYTKMTQMNLIIEERKRRIRELRQKAKDIKTQLVSEENQKRITTTELQKGCENEDKEIKNLESVIENLSLHNKDSREDREQKYKEQLLEIKTQKEGKLAETIAEKERLAKDLEKLKDFERDQAKREEEREELRKQNEAKEKEIKNIEYNEHMEIIKRKERLKDEHKQKLSLEKEKAKLEAEKKISEIDKSIQQQNVRLDTEVNLQNDVIEFIEKQKETVFEENIGYKKDLDANIDTVVDYAKKQYEQNLKIKDLKGKISMLDKSLAQIVQDFEKEKELLKYQNEQIEKEQDEDIKNYKEQIKLKEREIKNIKALCQMILDQRSDVEQFFLEALEQVKEEVRKRKERNRESSLPDINKSQSRQSFNKSNSYLFGASSMEKDIKIALKDLDWEDRERVLRLLFSKMNSGVPCSNWRNPQQNVYASAHDLAEDENSLMQEENAGIGNMGMIQSDSKDENNIHYSPWQIDA
ncbi:unnamed protein product [Moneuplotes crassus]|uniref:Uncharacterized protein n=1 Tax=Euplotes crassus TaxID=5936 RepID=A0AAD1UIP6_EUPCR|nr:unnamed protein product [Moneuplotes crassus]